MIYKGDFTELTAHLKDSIARMKHNDRHEADFASAIKRMDFVNELYIEENFVSIANYVNRNRVFWSYSLYGMLHGNASVQFMAYRDNDGDVGEFIFYAADRQQKKMPIVLIVPYALGGESMVEDTYSGNLNQIEAEISLAQKHGFAVAWIYAGGKNYAARKTEKEITAVLNRLQSEFDIDSRRIYVAGSCEGGRRALVQLTLSPGRYAACATDSPTTLSGGIDGIPINLLPQMDKVPIILKHGKNDETAPVEHSRRFYAAAKQYGVPVEYIETDDGHIRLYRDYYNFAFDFFSRTNN